jgi:hypothetical protein
MLWEGLRLVGEHRGPRQQVDHLKRPMFVVYRIAMTRAADVLVMLLGDMSAGVLCSNSVAEGVTIRLRSGSSRTLAMFSCGRRVLRG